MARITPVARSLILFFQLLTLWLMLSGHYDPLLIFLGLLSAAGVTLISRRMGIVDAEGQPLALVPGLARYAPWLAKEIINSCLDVALRIVRPGLPIEPATIRVPAEPKTAPGLVAYANSITLTPGTISLEVLEDEIEVHALSAESASELQTGEMGARNRRLETS